MSLNNTKMLFDAARNLQFKRDSAIARNDKELASELNLQLEAIERRMTSDSGLDENAKSSRFTRPKVRNVSQTNPSIGYAKPIQQQKISNKYHCIVSGAKRIEPCGGCSNPKGCLSSSMQYKEQDQ